MSRIRQTISGSTGASENSIVFFPAGGHSHNGQNSTLIDTTVYSVYDFSPTFVGTDTNRDRSIRQENNRIAFEDLIKRVVNSSVLEPAGIRLNPGTLNGNIINANTITANEIAANTITADELVSNIVLVNNVIRSNNYSAGSTGWIISNTGSAEFNNVTVRGTVSATSGNIAGWTINTSNITGGSTILYSNGYINATAGSFSGTITANGGSIAGWTINSSNITGGSTILYSNGYISAASGSFTGLINATGGAFTNYITAGVTQIGKSVRSAADHDGIALDGSSWDNAWVRRGNGTVYFRAGSSTRYIQVDTGSSSSIVFPNFSVNNDGGISATSGTIGGWTIGSTSLTAGSTALYSNGYISAASGSFTGTITSSSGTIGGWTIAANRLESAGGAGTTFISPASGIFITGYAADIPANATLYQGYLRLSNYIGNTTINGSTVDTITVFADYFLEASDYRLKSNIKPLQNSIEKINMLNPIVFNWKDNSNNNEDIHGLIAHEVQSIFPYSVSGEKDAVDENGSPKFQYVGYTKLIPILISGIKELHQKILELENKINNLEGE